LCESSLIYPSFLLERMNSKAEQLWPTDSIHICATEIKNFFFSCFSPHFLTLYWKGPRTTLKIFVDQKSAYFCSNCVSFQSIASLQFRWDVYHIQKCIVCSSMAWFSRSLLFLCCTRLTRIALPNSPNWFNRITM